MIFSRNQRFSTCDFLFISFFCLISKTVKLLKGRHIWRAEGRISDQILRVREFKFSKEFYV